MSKLYVVAFQIRGAIQRNPDITADELIEVIKTCDQGRIPITDRDMREFRRDLTKVLQGGGQRWPTRNPLIACVAHAVRMEVTRKQVDILLQTRGFSFRSQI